MSWWGFCAYRGNDSGFSNGSSLAVGTIKKNLMVGMSVKKPVVPAAAEAPAAEAKPARKTAKSAVKTEKAPKTEKTAHKGRPPLSPEIYVEFAGKQYNITDLVDRAKADYRLTHKVGVQSCKIYVKPEEEAAYYVVNKVGGKLPL